MLPHKPPGPRARTILVVLGAFVGFAVGYASYLWLNPILEARDDWLREMRGILFTSILFTTFAGGLLGGWFARRIRAG